MNNEMIDYVKDKDSVCLKDLYALFPDSKTYTVRGTLNLLVKNGKIKRIERGKYTHI